MRAAIVIVGVLGCSPQVLPIDSGLAPGSTTGVGETTVASTTVPTTTAEASGGTTGGGSGTADPGSTAGAAESTGAGVCVPATGVPAEVAFKPQQGTGAGRQTLQAVVLDGAGDIYVAGSFRGELNFAGEMVSAAPGVAPFVARLDCAGELRWLVTGTADTGASGPANALILAGDDLYVGGSLVGTVDLPGGTTLDGGAAASFVARLAAADGSVIGSAVVADGANEIHALVVGDTGGVFAAGSCRQGGDQQGVLLAELSPDPLLVTQRCMYTPVPANEKHLSRASTLALAPGGDLLVGGSVNGPLAEFGPAVLGEEDAFIGRVPVPLAAGPANPFAGGWLQVFGGPSGADRVNGIAVMEDGSQEIVIVGKGEGQFFAEAPCQASSAIVTAYVTRLDANGACVAHEMMLTDAKQATEAHAVAVRGADIYVLGQFFGVLGVGGQAIAETQHDHGIRLFMLALDKQMSVQAQHFSDEEFVGADCDAKKQEQARALGRGLAVDDSLVAVVADACGTGVRVAGAPLADTDTVLFGLFPLP